MKLLRTKKLSKIVVALSTLALFLSMTCAPAYAADPPNAITDNGSATMQLPQGSTVGVFSLKATDANVRDIFVLSPTTPIKTILRPVSSSYQNFIEFDSLAPRMASMIGWHFIPGLEYELLVFPETTPATIIVSMSNGTGNSGFSWVNMNLQMFESFIEKNTLMGGQTEVFGLANQSRGYYDITVVSNITNLGVALTDSDGQDPYQGTAVNLNNSLLGTGDTHTFKSIKMFPTGDAQNTYGITLSSPSSSSGGTYRVMIQKVGSF